MRAFKVYLEAGALLGPFMQVRFTSLREFRTRLKCLGPACVFDVSGLTRAASDFDASIKQYCAALSTNWSCSSHPC